MIRLEITDPATGTVFVPHLPASLSFEMLRENPFFNRRGDYTYDIDISLRDPHNRAIYNHINRLTATSRPQNRRARLLCDGHVIADGTEVILKLEGDMLKVQIVAGNSELNYLTADENLRIREMDFGTIPTPTNAMARQTALKVFPDADYVFPQTIVDLAEVSQAHTFDDQEEYENWQKRVYLNLCDISTGGNDVVYWEGTTLKPMPFVLYVVERFIQQLGYTVGSNELRNDERWCKLIIIHGYDTLEIARMLPDWTAAEFLSQIETFFNCIITVNPITRVVDIKSCQTFLTGTQTTEIRQEDIVDDFERDYESDEVGFIHNYERLEYQLPGGEYWKRACLDKTVEQMCQKIEATLAQVDAMPIEDCQWKIFHNSSPDMEFVRIDERCPGTEEWADIYIRYIVNQFKPHGSTGETNTLKIIPVRTEVSFGPARICPVTELIEKKEDTAFKEAIGSSISETTLDNIQVCFYHFGTHGFGYNNDRTLYATQHTHPLCVTARDYVENVKGMFVHLPTYTGKENMTLELNGEHGLYNTHFRPLRAVNIEEGSKIRFRGRFGYDIVSPFLILGRLFICQQLKYTYADGHQHPIVEGTFYPYL